ncbi:hypothetical protein ACFQJC_02040 [Haloferax namakaokahaiae]|uniref:Uncharacterized protein n=1 Tax=Haloferax namakaokahaiae TaxID=1748331 RepID=A0ABD5ZAN4_9EURY
MAAVSTRDVPDHGIDEDRIADLKLILSETKLRLMQQLLASPTGALSSPELGARNEITESTIRDHLSDLRSREPQIVTTLEPSESPVPNGIPRTYFAVTEYGIDLLKQVGLYEQIGLLYDLYSAADLELQDPESHPVTLEDIESYEHRPTPDWF